MIGLCTRNRRRRRRGRSCFTSCCAPFSILHQAMPPSLPSFGARVCERSHTAFALPPIPISRHAFQKSECQQNCSTRWRSMIHGMSHTKRKYLLREMMKGKQGSKRGSSSLSAASLDSPPIKQLLSRPPHQLHELHKELELHLTHYIFGHRVHHHHLPSP